jgi:hypothetical protein
LVVVSPAIGADQLAVAPGAHLVASDEAPAVVVDPAVTRELGKERVGIASVYRLDGARDRRR